MSKFCVPVSREITVTRELLAKCIPDGYTLLDVKKLPDAYLLGADGRAFWLDEYDMDGWAVVAVKDGDE